jgi:hypothetical protein
MMSSRSAHIPFFDGPPFAAKLAVRWHLHLNNRALLDRHGANHVFKTVQRDQLIFSEANLKPLFDFHDKSRRVWNEGVPSDSQRSFSGRINNPPQVYQPAPHSASK